MSQVSTSIVRIEYALEHDRPFTKIKKMKNMAEELYLMLMNYDY